MTGINAKQGKKAEIAKLLVDDKVVAYILTTKTTMQIIEVIR